MPLVVGLFRQASYSPHQHRANDTAILERTLDHIAHDGCAVARDAAALGTPVWVKRGDVHAECDEDVVRIDAADVGDVVAAFAARGVRRVALQAHVAGPVLKFYGVADGRFFRWYPSDDPAH